MRARRIYGIETEFGVMCAGPRGRVLTAEETSRYLFRGIVAGGRSSNAFLPNGSRLYLDVGSHPEYATAECDDILQLVAYDRAGELVMAKLADDAQVLLDSEGIDGRIHLFKNNLDSVGNSFGSHENYLIERKADFARIIDGLIPFLVTRQILVGAGRVASAEGEPEYAFSQRADHMEATHSSATTRSRPLINTRDEPHADSDTYRRLHVIVGDSNMSEVTTWLKVAMTELVLLALEAGNSFRHLKLANPIEAIRAVSRGFLDGRPVELADGGRIMAVEIQREYLAAARNLVARWESPASEPDSTERDGADPCGPPPWVAASLELWARGLDAVETRDHGLVDTELDWAIKFSVLDRHRQEKGLLWSDSQVRRLELAYHDIAPRTGLFGRLEARGLAKRVCTDAEIAYALENPPQTTRARLRGAFIRAATDKGCDYSVDWVYLKTAGPTQRVVALKDPFAAYDDRVEALIASL